MAAIELPTQCTHIDLIEALSQAGIFADQWETLAIRIPPHCFVSSSAIAFLGAWGQMHKNKSIKFLGDPQTVRYLSRQDLFKHLGFEFEESFQRHAESGRFIPLRLVDSDTVFDVVNEICDLVLSTFEQARHLLPAFEWTLNELIDNIVIHAQSPVPGTVCAQFYPKKQRIDIGICDMGQGIKASLSQSHKTLWSHGDAITKAIQRGVSRDLNIGQGNGLAGSVDIIELNQGDLHIWTGNANFQIQKGQKKGFTVLPANVPGTGILLRLNTQKPVNLADTFISDNGWSYINIVAKQLEEKGLSVREKCLHTGGRPPAKALRNQILALLSEMDSPLVLDFAGVESASSSFLDELLGRLVLELGEEAFKKRIQIQNLSLALQDMANVVIHQRTHGLDVITEEDAEFD